MSTRRDEVPEEIEVDQYGHALHPELETKPFSSLEHVVGSDNDFISFDFAIASIDSETYVALHAGINSDTGHFIQDFDYQVIKTRWDDEGEPLRVAARMVEKAADWCAENNVRHAKTGWNQDRYYFVRNLARHLYRHGLESEEIASMSRRESWFRFGSKTLNNAIRKVCPLLPLEITRPPKK